MKVGDLVKSIYKKHKPIDDRLYTTYGIILDIKWNQHYDREEYFIFFTTLPYNGWWLPRYRLELISESR